MENNKFTELVKRVDFYLNELEKKSKISLEDYLHDLDTQAVIERRLEEVIQGCIDLGNYIISVSHFRTPTHYRDIFSILLENKIIGADMHKTLTELASFRNILIHEYAALNQIKVHEKFMLVLQVIPDFLKAVVKHLQK